MHEPGFPPEENGHPAALQEGFVRVKPEECSRAPFHTKGEALLTSSVVCQTHRNLGRTDVVPPQ